MMIEGGARWGYNQIWSNDNQVYVPPTSWDPNGPNPKIKLNL